MSQLAICSVCSYIDNDQTIKECVWCAMCKEWICEADVTKYNRRAIAAGKKLGNKVVRTAKAATQGCGCGKKG